MPNACRLLDGLRERRWPSAFLLVTGGAREGEAGGPSASLGASCEKRAWKPMPEWAEEGSPIRAAPTPPRPSSSTLAQRRGGEAPRVARGAYRCGDVHRDDDRPASSPARRTSVKVWAHRWRVPVPYRWARRHRLWGGLPCDAAAAAAAGRRRRRRRSRRQTPSRPQLTPPPPRRRRRRSGGVWGGAVSYRWRVEAVEPRDEDRTSTRSTARRTSPRALRRRDARRPASCPWMLERRGLAVQHQDWDRRPRISGVPFEPCDNEEDNGGHRGDVRATVTHDGQHIMTLG